MNLWRSPGQSGSHRLRLLAAFGAAVIAGLVAYCTARAGYPLIAHAAYPDDFYLTMAARGRELTLGAVLLSCGAYPAIEELLFRKFAFELLERFLPTSVAVVLAVSAFTVAHYSNIGTPYLLGPAVLGLACQVTYARRRSLMMCWVMHGTANLLVLMPKPSIYRLFQEVGVAGEDRMLGILLVAFVLCAGALTAVVWTISKSDSAPKDR